MEKSVNPSFRVERNLWFFSTAFQSCDKIISRRDKVGKMFTFAPKGLQLNFVWLQR